MDSAPRRRERQMTPSKAQAAFTLLGLPARHGGFFKFAHG